MIQNKKEEKVTGMVAVMKYMGMKIGDFKKEWAMLTDGDKEQLKAGVGEFDPNTGTASGTLTY
jgi:hypothetical protein